MLLIQSLGTLSFLLDPVDLCTKKKLFFKSDDIKYLACPHYKGTAIKHILEFARKDPRVPKYLPDERDIEKVPRQWIVNVCYTLIGKPFSDWVGESISSRN